MSDDWARILLTDPDLGAEPLSTVDIRRAVDDGRRLAKARRIGGVSAVAASMAIATALVPVAVADRDRDGAPAVVASAKPTSNPSRSPSPPPRPSPPAPPTGCNRVPLQLPAGTVDGSVFAGDPSGRFVVGLAHRKPTLERTATDDFAIGPDTGHHLVLWDGGQPSVLHPPTAGWLVGIDVNAAGTVALALIADHRTAAARTLNWVYREGTFTPLTAPGRWHTAQDIKARGDVVAAWHDAEGVHPPLVWPAGAPDQPRLQSGGDPGDGFVVQVGGIDDDGTVVGTATRAWPGSDPAPADASYSRPLYWSPDGMVHELPAPAGFGPNGSIGSVRAGIAVGAMERPNPDVDRRGSRATIWDLRGGTVLVDDRLFNAGPVNVHGWLVGQTADTDPGPRPAAIFAGRLILLPMPQGPMGDVGGARTLSDDGRTLAGTVRMPDDRYLPVRWLCS